MGWYRYAGPGPQEDGEGGLVRPGDVREFGQEPDWGPWKELAMAGEHGPEAPVSFPQAPPIPASAPAPVPPPPASPAPPAPFGTESAPEGT